MKKVVYNPRKKFYLTVEFLEERAKRSEKLGLTKQKWIQFSEYFLKKGYVLEFYEAKETYSKYITVTHIKAPGRRYMVRFSNHKPSRVRELKKDCDFFVGVTHTGTRTTREAALAVLKYFIDGGITNVK